MSCCTPRPSVQGADDFFSKQARKFIKRFRTKGLLKEQLLLEKGILATGISGHSILDIGCGVGGLHLRLLQQGASHVVGIDLAEGMIKGAETLSTELGLTGRTEYRVGDFVPMAASVPPADIVIMDRVVCCYEELDDLMRDSLAKAGHVYALSFPRPTILTKTLIHIAIGIATLFRARFHPFWHDWQDMMERIRKAGFRERYAGSTPMWTVRVYERDGSGGLPVSTAGSR